MCNALCVSVCVCVDFTVGLFTVFAHLPQCETKDCQREQASEQERGRERGRDSELKAHCHWHGKRQTGGREGIRKGQFITAITLKTVEGN